MDVNIRNISRAAAVVLSTTAACWTGTAAAQEQVTPVREVAALATMTATVEAVNHEERVVTLKGPEGNTFTFVVDERVKNLPQVEVGDKVKISYYQAIAIDLKKGGEGFRKEVVREDEASAQPGEKPAGVGVKEVTIVANILAINPDKPSVTLKGPRGNVVEARVKHPEKLKDVVVGDQVQITYTQAVAISVEEVE
jgi:hypothetical protein